MPGSGFAQTFMGMDVVIVRYLAWKAAPPRNRAVSASSSSTRSTRSSGAPGARRVSRVRDAASRDRQLRGVLLLRPKRSARLRQATSSSRHAPGGSECSRSAPSAHPTRACSARLGGIVNQMFPGMMGGMGSLALNQLLVVMDGIDNPPFFKRVFTNRFNTFLDATYVIPRKLRSVRLRMPTPKPRGDQIYFIGATNVPIDVLDPALIRPGRMGRHVWFRTPTKHDRPRHLRPLHHEGRPRDRPRHPGASGRARPITMGYSPAMIEQVCSMAPTFAHHDGRSASAGSTSSRR